MCMHQSVTGPYLKEAAVLEDIANQLIQVHQTLVVSDVMGENREHHGMLLDDRKNRKVRIMSRMKEE